MTTATTEELDIEVLRRHSPAVRGRESCRWCGFRFSQTNILVRGKETKSIHLGCYVRELLSQGKDLKSIRLEIED